MGGMSGGSSSTSSTQPYILSGPTLQASQMAAQAQVNAAQIASQAATQNTNNAIQALMQQYSTSLTYANPAINTGNQASAQMNYMLGLPAVSPGPTPTAPTAPQYASIGKNSNIVGNPQATTQFNNLSSQADFIARQENMKTSNYGPGHPDPLGESFTMASVAQQLQGQAADKLTPLEEEYLVNYSSAGLAPGASGNTILSTLEDNTNTPLKNTYQQQMTGYQQQLDQYNQQSDLYDKYNAMGTATPSQISNIVTNLPGFQFSQNQGINAIQNAASASGQLNSGNLLQSLDEFGQGLSQQYYQNYMGNLAGLSGLGQQSSGLAQQGANNLGGNIAGAYTNLGNSQANAALSAGQAMASSYLSPVANQQVRMFPYTTSSQTSTDGGASGALGTLGQGAGLLSSLGGLFSSKELKDKVSTPSTKDILDRVEQLNIDKWKYKSTDAEHIGPYAEEFKELFCVGDGQSINIIDMFGVLMGAVKELNIKIKALQEINNANV